MTRREFQRALALSDPAVTGYPRKFETLEVPIPTAADLGPNDVLVKGGYACLCGTDKEMATSSSHGAPTDGYEPLTLVGHERCGVIVAVGSNVSQDRIGQPVGLKVREGCFYDHSLDEERLGDEAPKPAFPDDKPCPECAAGREDNCIYWNWGLFPTRGGDQKEHGIFKAPGWFTPVVKVPSSHAIAVPDDMDWRLGVHSDSAAIGAKAFMEALAVGNARYQAWGKKRRYLMEDGSFKELPPRALILGITGNTGIHAASLMLSHPMPDQCDAWQVYGVGTTKHNESEPAPKIKRILDLGATYYALDRDDCGSDGWKTNPIEGVREKVRAKLGIHAEEIVNFDLIIDVCGATGTLCRFLESIKPYEILAFTSILDEGIKGSFGIGRFGHQITMNNSTVIGIVNCSAAHIELGFQGLAFAHKKLNEGMIEPINPSYPDVDALAPHALANLRNSEIIRTGVWFGDVEERTARLKRLGLEDASTE